MGNVTFSTLLKLSNLIETLGDEDLVTLLENFAEKQTRSVISSYRLSADDSGLQAYINKINEYGQDFLNNIEGVEQFIVNYIQSDLNDAPRAAKVQQNLFKQKAAIQQKINEFTTDIGNIVYETNAQELADNAAKQEAEQAQVDGIRQQVLENTASDVMTWGQQ